jgi:hypothetical protein
MDAAGAVAVAKKMSTKGKIKESKRQIECSLKIKPPTGLEPIFPPPEGDTLSITSRQPNIAVQRANLGYEPCVQFNPELARRKHIQHGTGCFVFHHQDSSHATQLHTRKIIWKFQEEGGNSGRRILSESDEFNVTRRFTRDLPEEMLNLENRLLMMC